MKTNDSVMREKNRQIGAEVIRIARKFGINEIDLAGELGTLSQLNKDLASHSLAEARRVDENTSDGYHTFKELYEFRKLYNAALFNEWAAQGKYNVHKSFKHHDGKNCFDGGWFIVMATLPTGQISNHYENKDWKLFKCEERFKADEWDGHTAQDVAKRLSDLLTGDNPERKEK